MEMNLRMGIDHKLQLSPTIYNNLQNFAEFKADIHSINIKARKDLVKQWRKLPFVATNDAIFNVLETWPPKWCAPNIVEIEKLMAQRKKEEAKLRIAQLAEKRRKEAAAAEARARGTPHKQQLSKKRPQ